MSAEELPQPPIRRRRTPPASAAREPVPDRPAPRAGRRYTRFVTLLKVALPALAFALLTLLVAWPQLQGGATSAPVQDSGALEMLNARYVGTDARNRPFSVIADQATRSADNPDIVDLLKPEAEMTQENGAWVAIQAERGRYDEKAGTLVLEGAVNLFHDEGYEFVTDEALLDMNDGTAWGNLPVAGQGPLGEIFATGFRLYDHGRTIVFTGHAHLNLTSGAGAKVTP